MTDTSPAAELRACPDCHVSPGQPHSDGCDVACCTVCGHQRITCKHGSDEQGWGQVWGGHCSAPDVGLRDEYAAAIRDAACTGDCGLTEAECSQHRIQPVVWHHGTVAEVSGTPEMFADAVLAVRDRTMQLLRSDLKWSQSSLEEADAAAADEATRANRAEAAIARVRALADDMRSWCSYRGMALHYSDAIRTALDGPTPEDQ